MRKPLPGRRFSATVTVRWGNQPVDMSFGFFPDGQPAEAFVNTVKIGSEVQALGRDGAVLLSLALQYGCPLDLIQRAITRGEKNEPQSLIGALVDAFDLERQEMALASPVDAPGS